MLSCQLPCEPPTLDFACERFDGFLSAHAVVPIGGMLWAHLFVTLFAVVVLVRLAHREVPFPVALAQLRLGGDDPAVLRARVLSAAACLPQGRPDLTLYRLKSVLPDLHRVLGPDHPDTLPTTTSL
jgi:hypothetical protein